VLGPRCSSATRANRHQCTTGDLKGACFVLPGSCFPPLVRVAFLRWPRLSASTSTHGGGDSACSAITKRQTILSMPCKAVPKAKQDGSVFTIAARAVPTTSTRHERLLGTAARRQETHCNSCTPTTSSPTTSAHTAIGKDACWELQHKRPVWPAPKT